MSTKITTEEFIKHTDIELYNEMYGSSGKQKMGKGPGKKRRNPQKEWDKKVKQQRSERRIKKQGI